MTRPIIHGFLPEMNDDYRHIISSLCYEESSQSLGLDFMIIFIHHEPSLSLEITFGKKKLCGRILVIKSINEDIFHVDKYTMNYSSLSEVDCPFEWVSNTIMAMIRNETSI